MNTIVKALPTGSPPLLSVHVWNSVTDEDVSAQKLVIVYQNNSYSILDTLDADFAENQTNMGEELESSHVCSCYLVQNDIFAVFSCGSVLKVDLTSGKQNFILRNTNSQPAALFPHFDSVVLACESGKVYFLKNEQSQAIALPVSILFGFSLEKDHIGIMSANRKLILMNSSTFEVAKTVNFEPFDIVSTFSIGQDFYFGNSGGFIGKTTVPSMLSNSPTIAYRKVTSSWVTSITAIQNNYLAVGTDDGKVSFWTLSDFNKFKEITVTGQLVNSLVSMNNTLVIASPAEELELLSEQLIYEFKTLFDSIKTEEERLKAVEAEALKKNSKKSKKAK